MAAMQRQIAAQARILLQIYGAGIKFCFQNGASKARTPLCGLNPPQARNALKRHKILSRLKHSNRATPQAEFHRGAAAKFYETPPPANSLAFL